MMEQSSLLLNDWFLACLDVDDENGTKEIDQWDVESMCVHFDGGKNQPIGSGQISFSQIDADFFFDVYFHDRRDREKDYVWFKTFLNVLWKFENCSYLNLAAKPLMIQNNNDSNVMIVLQNNWNVVLIVRKFFLNI